jgi:hypothetical protein
MCSSYFVFVFVGSSAAAELSEFLFVILLRLDLLENLLSRLLLLFLIPVLIVV